METKFREERTTICGMVGVAAVAAVADKNLDIGEVRGKKTC